MKNNYLIIANPSSGILQAKKIAPIVQQELSPHNTTLIFTEYSGHATKIAQDFSEGDYKGIIIIGGDQINKNIYNFFNKNKLNGYVSYGMTETSSGISGYFVKDQSKYKKGYLGKFHDGVSIVLENGKIKIFSESVMYGYENCKPCEGCLLTSDFGYYDDDKLYFKARKERFIISGGENINLDVVEKLIGEYFSNIDFRVNSKKSEKWGEEIVIIISGNKDSKLINSMGEYCRKNLPKYMIPKHFLFIKSMLYDEIIQFDEKIKYAIMDSLK